ncbi:MAG TPA: hypothetical protein VFE55_19455 [Acidimicrobiia bacterium]|nr:hypothetical protein [Acidimicrobiia bacterium]
MFNRVTTLTGATDIDATLQYLRNTALPVTRSQAGYRGLSASVDREAGVLTILTMWDSPASRDASDSAAAKSREEASRLFSGDMTVELFEEVSLTVATPAEVGASLRVARYTLDPARLDDIVSYFDAELVPRIKAMAGFRALRNMVNRETGAGMVGTVWDDVAAMQQADGQMRGLRDDVGLRGVSFGETTQRRIEIIDLP